MTWQATLKPYKHQITHLGRVDIVISAENFFFCCENSSVKRGKTPTGGPRPTLPTPACCPPKQKKNTPATQRRLGGEVGPHSHRVTIGRRTGGRTEGREGPPRRGGEETVRGAGGVPSGAVSEEWVCCRASVWCLLAPSRGGVPLLGETRSAEPTLGDPCLL